MEAAFEIAKYAANLKYEDIPPQIIRVVKTSLLDILGVTLGASGVAPGIKELVSFVKQEGGKKESSILGFGGRVPSYMAAFCNGAMSHALDYDDMNDRCGVHPSSSLVPAALATAELAGNVSGKDFLTAIALGQDLTCRMGLAIKNRHGWHTAPVFGIFGGTAACGKILNFGEKQYASAFGIALSQAGTTMEIGYSTGSELRGIYPAFSAKGAVLSAMMTKIGISGPEQSLEGSAGLFNTYFRGEYSRDLLLEKLGREFENRDITFKLWPVARPIHPYIDGALTIANEENLEAKDIEKIIIHVGGLSERCTIPIEERRHPVSTLDAKYSLPFSVATALVNKHLAVQDVTLEGIQDKEVLAMAQKVEFVHSDEVEELYRNKFYAGKIEIHTTRKEIYARDVRYARGHPKNPLTREEILSKFMECATRFAVNPVSQNDAKRGIERIDNLEDTNNITDIIQLLTV